LLLALPLTVGLALILAGSLRGDVAPVPDVTVALAGNLLLGFAIASVLRRSVGEPGAVASVIVILVVIAPALCHSLQHWIQTFPAGSSTARGLPSDAVWSIVAALSVVAICASTSRWSGQSRTRARMSSAS
jgi:hypothetical protein